MVDTSTLECGIRESEFCKSCKDRVCSKVPIIKTILSSGNNRKIQNLIDVLYAFDLKVKDYI